jgi:hypothetical protein
MARDGDAGRFDLLTGHWAAGKGLQAEFSEGESVAALGIASAGTLHRLAVFGSGG